MTARRSARCRPSWSGSGAWCILPLGEGTEAEAREVHEASMVLCDAVIIFYGTASEHWVRMRLFDLVKAPGWGRREPVPGQGRLGCRAGHAPQAGVCDRRSPRPPRRPRAPRRRSLWSRFSPSSPRPRPGDDVRASFNPYPGLRPFRESEAHLFFGRSTHVDELLGELASSRFVAVMGASGSGKSSLVSAGLLPALHGGFVAAGGIALARRVVPAWREPDPQPRPGPRRAGGPGRPATPIRWSRPPRSRRRCGAAASGSPTRRDRARV